MKVCSKQLPEITGSGTHYWNAYVNGYDHICGTGETPEEALGWLVFHNPQIFDVNNIKWVDKPPRTSTGLFIDYPKGKQNTQTKEFINKVKMVKYGTK